MIFQKALAFSGKSVIIYTGKTFSYEEMYYAVTKSPRGATLGDFYLFWRGRLNLRLLPF